MINTIATEEKTRANYKKKNVMIKRKLSGTKNRSCKKNGKRQKKVQKNCKKIQKGKKFQKFLTGCLPTNSGVPSISLTTSPSFNFRDRPKSINLIFVLSRLESKIFSGCKRTHVVSVKIN